MAHNPVAEFSDADRHAEELLFALERAVEDVRNSTQWKALAELCEQCANHDAIDWDSQVVAEVAPLLTELEIL